MKMLLAALAVVAVAMPAEAKDRFDAAGVGQLLKSLATPEFDALTLSCEKWIKEHALETSPVTYQRINVEGNGKPRMQITYDAQNVYGAIVRKKQLCLFDDAGHLIEH